VIYGLYLSAAGMQTQNYRLDVIANNMANATTTAFKRDVAVFQARPPESETAPRGLAYRHPVLDRLGGGTFAAPTATEFLPGEMEITSRDLDLYLKDPGFLAVRDADGQVRYTRDGRLTVAETGQLALLDGPLVLDASGQPIQLDPSLPVAISADGSISQGSGVVAQLQATLFQDMRSLRKVGDNLYEAGADAARQERPAHVVSGALERSTVEPVTELVAMMEAQRAYEANAQLIRIQDQTLGRVINDLPRNL